MMKGVYTMIALSEDVLSYLTTALAAVCVLGVAREGKRGAVGDWLTFPAGIKKRLFDLFSSSM
jgi:hypothetical protein